MSRSYKRLKNNQEDAQQKLRNKEFLAERKRQLEREDAEDKLNLTDYLRVKGELE
jgi:hypothetical protein